jgi:hypothetical protein
MANAVTLASYEQGNEQFQGAFKEMWKVTATAAFDTNVAADAGEEFALTVPNVALGDMVIGIVPTGADPEPNVFTYTAEVTAANTVNVAVKATDADTPGPTGFKILVGRPSW